MLEFVVFCCAFSVLFLEWWLCLAVVLLLEASILHVCLWCCWYLAVEVKRVFDYGVMWLHASVLLNWVLLSEWSGRRGEVYDFGGLGCSQRLPLSVWVVPATLRVPVAGWPKKRELGPLSSGQEKLMPFVDPDRIEQSDRVQAASFAPIEQCRQFYAGTFVVLSDILKGDVVCYIKKILKITLSTTTTMAVSVA